MKRNHDAFLYAVYFISIIFIGKYIQQSDNYITTETSVISGWTDYALYSVIASLAISAPILVTILLDLFIGFEFFPVRDQISRLAFVLIIIVPGICMVKYAHATFSPHIFLCFHVIQVVGYVFPLYSLCNDLVPAHFRFEKVFVSCLFWACSGVLLCSGFQKPSDYRLKFSSFGCLVISRLIFAHIIVGWARDVFNKSFSISAAPKHVVLKIVEVLTQTEVYCICYVFCAEIFLVWVPSKMFGLLWCKGKSWDPRHFCYCMCSLLVFLVVWSAIPSRVRLSSAKAQINEKIRLNHTTVRYVSHEIRSPLNIVQSAIKLLLTKPFWSPDVLETLTDIQDASSAAICVADELLNLEKIEAGTFKIEKEYIRASNFLTRATNSCRTLAKQKNIRLSVQNHIEEPNTDETFSILVDGFKMEQVLRNLLVNSIKFTPPEGSIVVTFKFEPFFRSEEVETPEKVDARTKFCKCVLFFWRAILSVAFSRKTFPEESSNFPNEHGSVGFNTHQLQHRKSIYKNEMERKHAGWVRIDISDTGVGITESQRHSVFGEFVQFNANDLQGGGGSGLGLWICKQIITQHQGTITVNSKGLHRGTTFSICLKCYLTEAVGIEHNSSHPVTPSHDPLENSISILRYDSACRSLTSRTIKKMFVFEEKEVSDEKPVPNMGNISSVCLYTEHITRTVNILIVDDSGLNRKFLKRIVLATAKSLTHRIDVVEADDGMAAVDLVKHSSEEFSLVLMDNIMTNMHGPQAAKQMREHGFKGLIIGVTGNVTDADITDFKNHGANDVLKKPVTPEMISFILAGLLDQAEHDSV